MCQSIKRERSSRKAWVEVWTWPWTLQREETAYATVLEESWHSVAYGCHWLKETKHESVKTSFAPQSLLRDGRHIRHPSAWNPSVLLAEIHVRATISSFYVTSHIGRLQRVNPLNRLAQVFPGPVIIMAPYTVRKLRFIMIWLPK